MDIYCTNNKCRIVQIWEAAFRYWRGRMKIPNANNHFDCLSYLCTRGISNRKINTNKGTNGSVSYDLGNVQSHNIRLNVGPSILSYSEAIILNRKRSWAVNTRTGDGELTDAWNEKTRETKKICHVNNADLWIIPRNLWTPKYFLIKLNNKQNEIWDFIFRLPSDTNWYWLGTMLRRNSFFTVSHRISSVPLNAYINQIEISNRLCFHFVRRPNSSRISRNTR